MAKPSKSESRAAYVIWAVVTELRLPVMASVMVWASGASKSTFIMAVMPWGTVLVGITTTCFSVRAAHCWAAIIMLPLLGRTNTVSAGILFTPSRILSVEGFMVCPPDTTPSAPRSRNTAARPSPAHTARKP